MHIPDGFLSAPVAVACATLSIAAVGAAASRARGLLGTRAVPIMGVTAAFVFVAQMLNFPVAGGTSGHFVGGVLAAVLLGPSAAVIVMTAVLAMQCFVLGDGGLLALGANVLNMAVVHPVVGYTLYRLVAGPAGGAGRGYDVRRVAALAFASWAATVVVAAACAGELALSRVAAAGVLLPAMTLVHLAIGLGEAVIGALVFAAILRLRPALVDGARPSNAEGKAGGRAGSVASTAVLGLAVSLGLALFVSPFACRWPDGLERVVERLGVEPASACLWSLAPLHAMAAGGSGSFLEVALAAAGTLFVFAFACGLGFWLAPPSRS